MGNDFYRKIGAAFLFVAAMIYTLERITNKITNSIQSTGNATMVSNFFENLFVPAFTLIGIILFVYGFPRNESNGLSTPMKLIAFFVLGPLVAFLLVGVFLFIRYVWV